MRWCCSSALSTSRRTRPCHCSGGGPKRDENSEETQHPWGVLMWQANNKTRLNQKSFLRTLFCTSFSDPENASISLGPFVLSLSSWSNKIQIVQSPLQSFSPKTHLVVVSSPGGINSMMCRHPTASCAFGSGQSNLCHDVSSIEIFFCDYSHGSAARGIEDMTDSVLPRVTWCWVFQNIFYSIV